MELLVRHRESRGLGVTHFRKPLRRGLAITDPQDLTLVIAVVEVGFSCIFFDLAELGLFKHLPVFHGR